MAADDSVNVKIAVDQSEVEEGSQQASSTIDEMLTQWKTSFEDMFRQVSSSMKNMTTSVTSEVNNQKTSVEQLGESFKSLKNFDPSSLLEGLGGIGIAIGGVIAACGAFFVAITEVVNKTAEYGHELEKTSQITGVSTDALQAWSLGAQECGLSADTFEKATKKLSREIAEVVQGSTGAVGTFKELGISQAEVTKHSEDMEWIVRKVADSFKNHTDGLEKARIAQELFGRAGLELIPLLNRGSEGFDELAKKAKELGIVMGKDDTEACKAYNATSADLHAAWSGFCRDIGEIFMPALSRIHVWFTDIIEGCEKACSGIADVTSRLLKLAGVNKWNPKDHSDRMNAVEKEKEAELAKIVMIKGETLASYNQRKAAAEEYYKNKMKWIKDCDEADAKSEANKGKSTFVTPPKKTSTKTDNKQENEEKKNAIELAKELEKIAEGSIEEQEKDVKDMVDNGIITRQEGEKRLETLYKNEQMAKETVLNKEYEEIKKTTLDSEGALKVHLAKIQELEQNTANKIKDIRRTLAKDEKKDADTAAKEQQRLAADSIKNAKETADSEIDEQRAKNAVLVAQGRLTESEMLKADIDLDNQKIASDNTYFAALKVLYANDAEEYQKVLLKELKIKRENNLLKLGDDKKMADQDNKIWENLSRNMEQSFTSSITSMLKKEQKFSQSLKNIWNNMASFFIETIIHKMMEKFTSWCSTKLAMETTTEAAGVVVKKAADQEKSESTFMTTMKEITSKAVAAAGGAYDAIVGIPYVGPVLAPIAAAVAFAGVEAFGALASAEGGYDIPTGVNPVTQLHQQEMVLPKELANSVRNMTAGGGGSNTSSTHVSVNAIDSKSFSRYLSGNKKAIKSLGRNFAL